MPRRKSSKRCPPGSHRRKRRDYRSKKRCIKHSMKKKRRSSKKKRRSTKRRRSSKRKMITHHGLRRADYELMDIREGPVMGPSRPCRLSKGHCYVNKSGNAPNNDKCYYNVRAGKCYLVRKPEGLLQILGITAPTGPYISVPSSSGGSSPSPLPLSPLTIDPLF